MVNRRIHLENLGGFVSGSKAVSFTLHLSHGCMHWTDLKKLFQRCSGHKPPPPQVHIFTNWSSFSVCASCPVYLEKAVSLDHPCAWKLGLTSESVLSAFWLRPQLTRKRIKDKTSPFLELILNVRSPGFEVQVFLLSTFQSFPGLFLLSQLPFNWGFSHTWKELLSNIKIEKKNFFKI